MGPSSATTQRVSTSVLQRAPPGPHGPSGHHLSPLASMGPTPSAQPSTSHGSTNPVNKSCAMPCQRSQAARS
eukprot:11143005-Heterocapsa_arctica.AAC.1